MYSTIISLFNERLLAGKFFVKVTLIVVVVVAVVVFAAVVVL